ncbi:MAG: DNA polymerase III subunit beta [Pleurocapsa sp.]
MKIICSQSDLKYHLSLANRVIPSRAEPVILGNVLITALSATQKVSITAYDGSLGIKSSFHAEVEAEGSITVPAKLLNEIVTKLSEVEITLESSAEEEQNFVTTIGSASGTFQLTGIDAAEFPALPTVDTGENLELPIFLFNQGLGGCLFAASTELSKQILTGVHIKTQDNGDSVKDIVEFAATDSHRLAVVEVSVIPEEEETTSTIELSDFAVTIPAKALRELEKIVSDAEDSDTVKVSFDDSQIIFEYGDRILTSLRILGDYPAYNRLIPQNFSRQMIVERKRLLNSLELVAVLAQKNNIVKFSLDKDRGELIISADAKDIGSAKQSLPAEIMGENIDIAFNIKYLMDGLKALTATEIKMQLNEWNQPVIFRPLGSLKMTYLVMPVQIRN